MKIFEDINDKNNMKVINDKNNMKAKKKTKK